MCMPWERQSASKKCFYAFVGVDQRWCNKILSDIISSPPPVCMPSKRKEIESLQLKQQNSLHSDKCLRSQFIELLILMAI